MSLRNLDYLSPKITLYYYGKKKHASKIGAILTLIGAFVGIIYIFVILRDTIQHNSPSLLFHKKFNYEAGTYYLNNDGIYHFIQIYNYKNNGYFSKYEQKKIRIFLTSKIDDYPTNPIEVNQSDYWIYDLCEKEIDTQNIDNSLINAIDNFTNSACIKYYYNSKENKYYNKTSNNFKYPYIAHGNSRKDNIYQGIIIEKCNNNSILSQFMGECDTRNEIDDYLNDNIAFFISFIDNQIDPSNFENPIKKIFNTISSSFSNETYPIHNINFVPLLINTDKGLVFKETHKNIDLIFETNRKDGKKNIGNQQILAEIFFWLSNDVSIYERVYKKITDVLPSIGGIIDLLYYSFFALNYTYHKYKTSTDTKTLFSKINTGIETEINEREEMKIFNEENRSRQFKKIIGSFINLPQLDVKQQSSVDCTFTSNNKNKNKEDLLQSLSLLKSNNKKNNISNNYVKKRTKSNALNGIPYNNYKDASLINLNNKNEFILNINKNDIDYFNINNNKKQNQNIIKIKDKDNSNHEFIIEEKSEEFDIKNFKNNYKISFPIKQIKTQRFNGFKEDLKHYIRESKKKLYIPQGKIKYLQNKYYFFNYLNYLCCKSSKQKDIYILEIFRKKLLSEEHFYRAHINLYLLEKFFRLEKENTDILELYMNL